MKNPLAYFEGLLKNVLSRLDEAVCRLERLVGKMSDQVKALDDEITGLETAVSHVDEVVTDLKGIAAANPQIDLSPQIARLEALRTNLTGQTADVTPPAPEAPASSDASAPPSSPGV